MSGNNNFTPPQDFREAWMRLEKRQQRQERRIPGAAGAIVSGEGLAERVFQGAEPPALSQAFMVPASGWGITAQSGIAIPQSYGSLVQWHVQVSRTGAALTVGTGGNITNSTIGTLTAGWTPIVDQGAHTDEVGRVADFYIAVDGTVSLSALSPGAGDVVTGEPFSFGAFYIAVNAVG